MEHLAWPVVVLVLVLAFFVIFRGQVAGFIDRTKTLKVPGLHAEGETSPQLQAQSKQADQPLIGGPERLGTPLSDDVLSPMDQEFHRLIQASVPDPTNHLPWALRLLSHVSLQRDHEITARLIFNSQLQALKAAAQLGGAINLEQLKVYYDSVAGEFDGYSFDRWWKFMEQRRLINSEGHTFHLTNVGRNYLAYVAAAGIRDPAGL